MQLQCLEVPLSSLLQREPYLNFELLARNEWGNLDNLVSTLSTLSENGKMSG